MQMNLPHRWCSTASTVHTSSCPGFASSLCKRQRASMCHVMLGSSTEERWPKLSRGKKVFCFLTHLPTMSLRFALKGGDSFSVSAISITEESPGWHRLQIVWGNRYIFLELHLPQMLTPSRHHLLGSPSWRALHCALSEEKKSLMCQINPRALLWFILIEMLNIVLYANCLSKGIIASCLTH